ncbi:hypothetical protein Sdagh_14680 [Streptomyces daghestanicus]|uniref:ABC transporter domain-containing protein n=1 Tax=Streptomyces daghestanicus TaxID=66885 RepID=A0ABQ3PXI8_9ACTN|nr:hypothetical protein Sdagh_14680 [Streptomyces daghestanicus]
MRSSSAPYWDDTTVRDLLVSVAPPRIRDAARAVDAAEHAVMTVDDEAAQMRYAQALSDWAEARGYEAETLWDMCTTAALGVPYEKAQWRRASTLSGGEQKRLVLEALLRGTDQVLLLDEPDNYPRRPGKRWLEQAARGDPQDRPVRLPRPGAAGPRRRADRLPGAGPGRRRRLGARRLLRHVPRRPAASASPASRNCAAAGTRSTPS